LELNSFSHGYGQITYHIVLVPRYRYNVFYNERVKKDCETIFNDICVEHGYRIHALEIVDDHVHMFVEFHPTNSLSEVIQYLKGGSAYRLFKAHPELRKRYWGGHFWSDGKFYRSVGNVTADTIRHYITESQGKPKNIIPEQLTELEKVKPTKEQSSINNFL
jgi:putative transposase